MSEFRERKLEERAKKIAHRIAAERRVGVTTAYPSLDSLCAPGASASYRAPEPSKETLEHMASFGYVLGPEDASPQSVSPVPVSAVSETVAAPTLAEAIAEGVSRVLASMGFRQPVPVPTGDTPPRNEDR